MVGPTGSQSADSRSEGEGEEEEEEGGCRVWWCGTLPPRIGSLDSRPRLRIVCHSSARRPKWPSRSSFRVAASAVVVNQKSFGSCSQEICIRGALPPPRGVGRLRLQKGTYYIQYSQWTSSGVRRANVWFGPLSHFSRLFVLRVKEEKILESITLTFPLPVLLG